MKNLKAKEATIHKHLALFIQRMKEVGGGEKGAELQRWTDWLGLDLSSDLTYGRSMGQMRESEYLDSNPTCLRPALLTDIPIQTVKDSILLSATLKLNLFVTLSQVTRKYRILTPLVYLTIPPSVWLSMPKLIRLNTEEFATRIQRRGKTEHLDYFEQLVPTDRPEPKDKKDIYHLENVAAQLLLAGWQPLSNQFYSILFFLLSTKTKSNNTYETLAKEVRESFPHSNAITTETTAGLKYLNACTQESLRLHQETVDGLPRRSPGAIVDGKFIPKGVGTR